MLPTEFAPKSITIDANAYNGEPLIEGSPEVKEAETGLDKVYDESQESIEEDEKQEALIERMVRLCPPSLFAFADSAVGAILATPAPEIVDAVYCNLRKLQDEKKKWRNQARTVAAQFKTCKSYSDGIADFHRTETIIATRTANGMRNENQDRIDNREREVAVREAAVELKEKAVATANRLVNGRFEAYAAMVESSKLELNQLGEDLLSNDNAVLEELKRLPAVAGNSKLANQLRDKLLAHRNLVTNLKRIEIDAAKQSKFIRVVESLNKDINDFRFEAAAALEVAMDAVAHSEAGIGRYKEKGWQEVLEKTLGNLITSGYTNEVKQKDNAGYQVGYATGLEKGRQEAKASFDEQLKSEIEPAQEKGIVEGKIRGAVDVVAKMVSHKSNEPPKFLEDGTRNPAHIATLGHEYGSMIFEHEFMASLIKSSLPKQYEVDDLSYYEALVEAIVNVSAAANGKAAVKAAGESA